METKEIDFKKWAQDAINVQDACNLSGVAYSFSKFMGEMCAAGYGTDARNTHPITKLFVDKMYDLAFDHHLDRTGLHYTRAYDRVKELAR